MPSKKPDPTTRAETMAQFVASQFVFDPDVHQAEPVSVIIPQPPKHAKSSAPPTQLDSTLMADREKDKDKERVPEKAAEKKDKDVLNAKDVPKEAVTIEDLNLPKSIITRLAKGVLPSNTQIQANAILAMSKSATVFVNHLAHAANQHTLSNNKKTIMPSDVFEALGDIEFPFFRERLEAEFKKFNDTQTSKRTNYRRKVAAQKRADKAGTSADVADADSASPPRAKKQKPNATHEDATMDVDDGDETLEPHDASDPESESEPEPEQEDEDEEEDDDVEEEEEEEDDDEEEDNPDEILERLEERKHRGDSEDEALDHSDDSD